MYLHFYALLAVSLCIAAGLFYRVAVLLLCVGFTYLFLLDQARYLNHWYLICLISFLLIFVPAHRALSVDARLRPRLRSEQAPAWTLVAVSGADGASCTSSAAWPSSTETGCWVGRCASWLPGSIAPSRCFSRCSSTQRARCSSAGSGLLFDLFVVASAALASHSALALAAALAFHLINSQMFDIGVFPWLAIWLHACVLRPGMAAPRSFNWPRREPLPATAPLGLGHAHAS